jgi:hypothetical protein
MLAKSRRLAHGHSLWWVSEFTSSLITLSSRGIIYDELIYGALLFPATSQGVMNSPWHIIHPRLNRLFASCRRAAAASDGLPGRVYCFVSWWKQRTKNLGEQKTLVKVFIGLQTHFCAALIKTVRKTSSGKSLFDPIVPQFYAKIDEEDFLVLLALVKNFFSLNEKSFPFDDKSSRKAFTIRQHKSLRLAYALKRQS